MLSRETSIQLTLQFLYSYNKLHFIILNTIKQSVKMRNNILHIKFFLHSTMLHKHTLFKLDLNMSRAWLTRATNWTKFSATALQLIDSGHLQQRKSLMAPCHRMRLVVVAAHIQKHKHWYLSYCIIIDIKYQRLDKLQQILIQTDNIQVTLYFCNHVSDVKTSEILTSTTLMHMSPDYLSICQLLMFLDRPQDIAAAFEKLLRAKSKNDGLLGFQIAFDLVENEHQAYLLKMRD
ncbi:unnamed protein product [Coffea canephora]|uniref:DH200=94 genomic scaffold, scaffold_2479 n=1 Tax=Coffea canephora TaxID=49390 RepID=A0A068VK70_COFCA|nr:unnamed protein product [Coffea canephora]